MNEHLYAGTHTPLIENQTVGLNCIICEKPVYMTGVGVDVRGKAHIRDYKKAIALECVKEMIEAYSPVIRKMGMLDAEGEKRLLELEVTNKEYLAEMEQMTAKMAGNKRLGFLFGWVNELPPTVITPGDAVSQFHKDMDALTGVEG